MFDYFTDPNTNIWMDILDIAVRSVASIVVLFLLAKVLGNKQIKQLSFFDYVVGISIGSIAAEMATNTDFPHHFFIIAMLVYTLISLLVGLISLKSVKGRRFLEGTPVVLIENGKLIYKNLKKSQMTVNSLLAECRYAGYFDIADIETAILETSGEISILPKSDAKPVTAQDMNLQLPPSKPRANVIIDGKLILHNLHSVKKTESWLMDKLNEKNISVNNVLLATLDEQGELQVYDKSVEPKRFDMFD
ncbi:MAG: DUF421 domain-containing protein [Corallococcus sp.]|nr:DUF421 domain-containing protein [Corallococcus sp.]MCM1359413.1 DUF421 domain-containing protein [Corallococcus sp.]MCM1394856.1 DUF421 domain-containing protein [Corallococcus sp.]